MEDITCDAYFLGGQRCGITIKNDNNNGNSNDNGNGNCNGNDKNKTKRTKSNYCDKHLSYYTK